MNQVAVEIENLTCRFGDRDAVSHLSLRLKRGVIFGFIGENGAGKTTTIRVLMGLLRPTEGKVRVLGENPLGGKPDLLQRVTYVSDDRAMYRWMRVREVIAFNAGLYEKWDDPYAEQLLTEFELDPKRKVKELSRGQIAKLALLCALAPRPELLILDEVSSGLDPMVRRTLLEMLIDVSSTHGTTIFLSSHILEEVNRVADEIGILVQGRLVAHGGKDEIRSSLKRVVFSRNGDRDSDETLDREWILADRKIGQERHVIVRDFDNRRLACLVETVGSHPRIHDLTLEDVFAEYTDWGKKQ